MSRSNETKLAGVQVVGYGHPTIYVIENVNEGTIAVMSSGLPWQSTEAPAMEYCLASALVGYLRTGLIRWAKGRPVREGTQLIMPNPVQHSSQGAFAKAAALHSDKRYIAKSPNFSAGFGQAVIDEAAKRAKEEAAIANFQKHLGHARAALRNLHYSMLNL